jgi:two-component system, OmpR family, response regulator QseB
MIAIREVTMRILIVEDDDLLARGIKSGLMLTGATVDCVETCADALAALSAGHFSAVVLDVMLPDGNGVEMLRAMRLQSNRTPVLLLTARDAIGDRVAGLDAGADDYLVKPFDLDELAARLRAITRRGSDRLSAHLEYRNIRVTPAELSVSLDGRPIDLSRREYALLCALMERPGQIRSRTELEERMYGWEEDVESNALEVHVHNLRTKIGRDAIQTLRGLGYRMRPL